MWIDKKGRLFGKINIIDLFVVGFLLFIVGSMGWFGWKIYKYPKKPQPQIQIQKANVIYEGQQEKRIKMLEDNRNNFLHEYPRYKKYFQDEKI